MGRGICIRRTNAQPGGAAMKQLEIGDRVKILDGGKDDEGTVLDVDEQTEMVIVYLDCHVGGWAFHRQLSANAAIAASAGAYGSAAAGAGQQGPHARQLRPPASRRVTSPAL